MAPPLPEISFSSQQEDIAAQFVCAEQNESAFYSKLFARLVRVRAHIYDLR
jgi:hypothetical protein